MKKILLAICLLFVAFTANAGISNDILGMTLGECDTVIFNRKTHEYDLVSVVAGQKTILMSIPKDIVDMYNEGQDDIIATRNIIDTDGGDWIGYGYKLMEYGERELMIANMMFDNYLLMLEMRRMAGDGD